MAGDTNIGDDAVVAATGHAPAHWFRLLDRWKGAEKGHAAMARWLRTEHGLTAWWCQMVTVLYERARGLRKVHERPTGFSIDVSRLVRTTAGRAFRAMADAGEQARWFTTRATIDLRVGGRYENADGDSGEFLKIVPPKLLRFSWNNRRHAPGSVVDYQVSPAGDGRVRIIVTHSKLARERDAKNLKEGWSWALDSLRSYLETGSPVTHTAWLAARKKRAARSAGVAKQVPAKAAGAKRPVAKQEPAKAARGKPAAAKRVPAKAAGGKRRAAKRAPARSAPRRG